MSTRRRFLSRLAVAAVGVGGVWLARDRLPGTGPAVRFQQPRGTPWLRLPTNEGLIEIDVSVEGKPLRALVDSGAEVSAIDGRIAQQLGLSPRVAFPVVAYGVTGGPLVSYAVALDLALPGLWAGGLAAAALDLDALARAANRDFQIIIGRDLLRHVVLDADYPRDRVRLVSPAQYRPPSGAVRIPMTRRAGAPMVSVRIEARSPAVAVMVDTGSSGVLALSQPVAQNAGLLNEGRLIDTQPTLGLGGLSLSRRVTAQILTLGEINVKNASVQIYPAQAGRPTLDGLLGAGFLRGYRMGLDLSGDALFLVRSAVMLTPPR